MNLLFSESEDRATVGTAPSADSEFTKESDARARHSFFVGNQAITLLWKTQSVKPRVWAEPSEPKAPLRPDAVPLTHRFCAVDHDAV